MEQIRMVAIDLAKNVFQVHCVNAAGQTSLQRRLRRSEVPSFFAALSPITIGMEACPGAHYWGRLLVDQGHDVRLVPPHYVKPFVQRQKNDAADAAAIYEAMIRPTMRFVPVKTHAQQADQVAIRTREVLVRQRTMSINALRGHLAEFGITAGVGLGNLRSLIERLEARAEAVPEFARAVVQMLIDQVADCSRRIDELTAMIAKRSASDAVARRLMTIPGVGPLTAAAILAAAPDASRFSCGRHFAAWAGVGAKAAFHGRSIPTRTHHEDGGSNDKAPLDLRRAHGDRPGQEASRLSSNVARPAGAAKAHACRSGGAGQQECPHCLGAHGQGRHLPRGRGIEFAGCASAAGGVRRRRRR